MNIKVLIAEDDSFLVKAYKMKMSASGFQVVVVTDGDAVLKKAKQEKPNIILLDIIMPKKSGFEVLKELKKDPETQSIPVIILSNLGQESDRKKGEDLGAADYLIKADFTLEEILANIRKFAL